MKNKIKSALYAMTVAIMTAPVMVSAQQGFKIPTGTGLQNKSVYLIVQSIMYWILGIVGFIGVIGFAIAGILYLTAAGDEDRIGTAKKAMLFSIVGVIVALMGLVIITAAQGLLGAKPTF